jgi:hypothetical protein
LPSAILLQIWKVIAGDGGSKRAKRVTALSRGDGGSEGMRARNLRRVAAPTGSQQSPLGGNQGTAEVAGVRSPSAMGRRCPSRKRQHRTCTTHRREHGEGQCWLENLRSR